MPSLPPLHRRGELERRAPGACLDAQNARQRMEVVLVDSASEHQTAALVAARHPQVRLLRADRNLGVAGGAALGTADTDAHVVLLNNGGVPTAGAVPDRRAPGPPSP